MIPIPVTASDGIGNCGETAKDLTIVFKSVWENCNLIQMPLIFTWQNFNPSKFALKTHIGIPPVIGEDGIIYGVYETLDIPEVPLTPAQESIAWETEVTVPEDVSGLYILLSVESKKPRTYVNYAIGLTD